MAPLAPKAKTLLLAGWKNVRPPLWIRLGSRSGLAPWGGVEAPSPRWTKAAASPSPGGTPALPHIPGLGPPHFRHSLSLTPTSRPHDGQTTAPVLWRRNMDTTLSSNRRGSIHLRLDHEPISPLGYSTVHSRCRVARIRVVKG